MLREIRTPGYNLNFDTRTGIMARWGTTLEEDPDSCPLGPEIADIEISTVCHGIGVDMERRQPCSWCYKSNTGCGTNMSLETFKRVFSRFPFILTQIAFGIGDIDGNPDLWNILKHCRDNGIIPNLTTNGMGVDDKTAKALAAVCGAVAVSHYGIDAVCFDAVDRLTKAGLQQVNIHKLLSTQTYKSCFELIDNIKTDPRLAKLRAVVFLLLKPKGTRNNYSPLASTAQYGELLKYAMERGVSIGMDSCSAPMVLRTAPAKTIPFVEPCESTLFSIYVDVSGKAYPCSFTSGEPGWEKGVDLLPVEDFLGEVWNAPRFQTWRTALLASSKGCKGCAVQQHCRSCPVFPAITLCKESK